MGTVLNEVAELFPELNIERIYVEVQVDEANHYKVKTNPTVLFTDENDKELYRLEGFHETDVVKEVIQKINQGKIRSTQELVENTETKEKYVIYLLKQGKFSSVEVTYNNQTSIKAPRITAVTLLLEASKEGYSNPFPAGTTLELVKFENTKGIITLKFEKDVEQADLELMKRALKLTLSHYGIRDIEILIVR